MQFIAFCEVLEGADFVDAERDDFEVRHFFNELQVLEVVTPQIEIFDIVEIV